MSYKDLALKSKIVELGVTLNLIFNPLLLHYNNFVCYLRCSRALWAIKQKSLKSEETLAK